MNSEIETKHDRKKRIFQVLKKRLIILVPKQLEKSALDFEFAETDKSLEAVKLFFMLKQMHLLKCYLLMNQLTHSLKKNLEINFKTPKASKVIQM